MCIPPLSQSPTRDGPLFLLSGDLGPTPLYACSAFPFLAKGSGKGSSTRAVVSPVCIVPVSLQCGDIAYFC